MTQRRKLRAFAFSELLVYVSQPTETAVLLNRRTDGKCEDDLRASHNLVFGTGRT